MNKKKSIIAAVVLSLILVVGGAIAYFTDTDVETNSFTLGNVEIDLDEPNFDSQDALNILPGTTITKDPQIENTGGASAYVFLKVTEPCSNGATIFDFTVNSGWEAVGTARSCSNDTAETVYSYSTSGTMTTLAANATTPALFNSVTLKSSLSETDVQAYSSGANIVVNAYGIQSDNVSGTPTQIFANFS